MRTLKEDDGALEVEDGQQGDKRVALRSPALLLQAI
jgi:hypothetical protein